MSRRALTEREKNQRDPKTHLKVCSIIIIIIELVEIEKTILGDRNTISREIEQLSFDITEEKISLGDEQ